MKFVAVTIKVPLPALIERAGVALLLLYRRVRYGYAFRRIKLTRGKYTIVDADDFEGLNRYKWYCSEYSYARRTEWKIRDGKRKRVVVWMHNVICSAPEGMVVDHINRNKLDNRKANLRAVTVQQNVWNRKIVKKGRRTRYTGIYWNKEAGKWNVRLRVNGRRKSFGYYADEVEAAKAYDAAVKEHRGEYAVLNFPEKRGNKRAAAKRIIEPRRSRRKTRNTITDNVGKED